MSGFVRKNRPAIVSQPVSVLSTASRASRNFAMSVQIRIGGLDRRRLAARGRPTSPGQSPPSIAPRAYSFCSALADDPGGHASLILNDRRLQRIEERAAEAPRQLDEQGLVHEVALAAVRKQKPPADRLAHRVSIPIADARRQNNSPPGLRTRHISPTMASNWRSSRAKWRTALLITASAKPSGNDICSTASTRKFAPGSCGASDAASMRTDSTASSSASTPNTS